MRENDMLGLTQRAYADCATESYKQKLALLYNKGRNDYTIHSFWMLTQNGQ